MRLRYKENGYSYPEQHIPLVDNDMAFSKLDYRDYSASDGHPNERGYFVMAENVFEEIKKINDKTAL